MLDRYKSAWANPWTFCGIEFAPLLLPLERRLETFFVFVWIWMILFLGVSTYLVLFYVLFYTRFWWISVAYFTWMLVDRNSSEQGGRSDKVRRFFREASMWKYYVKYFPIRLIKTTDLDPGKNYIFGSHPHGVLSSGVFGTMATEGTNISQVYPGLKFYAHTLAINFWLPFNREWVLGLGGVEASKKSITHLMTKPDGGNVSTLVIGGAAESMYTSCTQISLVLKRRYGFIKMALKTGAQLVPTFSFGEAHIYNILPSPEGSRIRNFQERFRNVVGFAPLLFFGRGIFQYSLGILPHRRPINVVVGAPIHVDKNENPTDEDVLKLHQAYISALEQLYEKFNHTHGDSNVKLKII